MDIEIDAGMYEHIKSVFDKEIAKYIVRNIFNKRELLDYDETCVVLQIFENGLADIRKRLR